MLEMFQYDFMVRAFIAGLIVASVVPFMGSFLVARRYSLIADGLAHVSLAGVGAGILLGTSPILLAIPVAIAGGLLLEYLRQNRRISGDTSLAIVMSGGLALAVVLANLAHNSKVDFSSFLFGSITTTSATDLIVLAIAAVVVFAGMIYSYKTLLYIAFDEDGARASGKNVSLYNYMLAAMTSLMVVLSLRIVGGLLISALLAIPVITAGHFARSFVRTVIFAIVFAAIAVCAGLTIAFYAGIAAGGAIVLSALAIFIFAQLLSDN